MRTGRAVKIAAIILLFASVGLFTFLLLGNRDGGSSASSDPKVIDGMMCTLILNTEEVLTDLARNRCEEFEKALDSIRNKKQISRDDYIDQFAEAWETYKGNKTLSYVFETDGSDEDILAFLREETETATDQTCKILSSRLKKIDLVHAEMIRTGEIIRVALPFEINNESMEKADDIFRTGILELWPTMSGEDIFRQICSADSIDILHGCYERTACVGFAYDSDTYRINEILDSLHKAHALDSNFRPMWTAKPSGENSDMYDLVAIYDDGNEAPINNSHIDTAKVEFNNTGEVGVWFVMNDEGKEIFRSMTYRNIGKQIAIALDNSVISYPVVNNIIDVGMASIVGDFTVEEAERLATILNIGKLPVSLKVLRYQKAQIILD